MATSRHFLTIRASIVFEDTREERKRLALIDHPLFRDLFVLALTSACVPCSLQGAGTGLDPGFPRRKSDPLESRNRGVRQGVTGAKGSSLHSPWENPAATESVVPLSCAFEIVFHVKSASVLILLLKLECKFLESREHLQKEGSHPGPALIGQSWLLGTLFGEGPCLTQEGRGSSSIGNVCCADLPEEGQPANVFFAYPSIIN